MSLWREDALNSVPNSYRQASLALGATQWQTIWDVTLPAAKTGVLTAVMLGIGRSLGETMAVMMVTGNAPVMPLQLNSLFRPVRTMTATIASEMGEVASGSQHYHVLFFIGITLFLLSLIINITASLVSTRSAPALGEAALLMKATGLNRAKVTQTVGFNLLRLVTLLTVIPIIGLVVYIVAKGAPAISWEFLTAAPSNGMREGGILPAIVGTLYLTLGTAIFSVPIGVMAGIYLAEYAQETRLTRIIRIAIINLAGIPSVVYGLFGLGLFVLFLKIGHQHPRCLADAFHHDPAGHHQHH